jgi:hypothetical protein
MSGVFSRRTDAGGMSFFPHLRFRPTVVLALAAVMTLCHCTPRPRYVSPSDLDPGSAAAIVGSKVSVSALLAEDIRVRVSAVDGKTTSAARDAWATPIVVTPGPHFIQLVALQWMGKVEIATRVDLKPGRTYTVRLDTVDGSRSVMIWLEDSQTGLSAGDKVEVLYRFSGIL